MQCGRRNPRQHLATAVELLVRVLDLPGRAAAILRQGLHELYTTFGVWSGQAECYPTLFRLYEWVRSKVGLNVQARDSILDRLAEGRLLTIHPFTDFNGRVTRLFLRELLHRLKLPPVDLVPTDAAGETIYFAALHDGDVSDWKPLMKIWEHRFEQFTDVPPAPQ